MQLRASPLKKKNSRHLLYFLIFGSDCPPLSIRRPDDRGILKGGGFGPVKPKD